MTPRENFRKTCVGIVINMTLARGKISNQTVVQRLGMDGTTIRYWRKKNIKFEHVFTKTRRALEEKVNHVAGKSPDVRKRRVVTTSSDDMRTTIEDVLPTHNDVAIFLKVLGLDVSVYGRGERQRNMLREAIKHGMAGKCSAPKAAQLLEAEGVEVPTALLMELGVSKVFEPFNNMDEAAKASATSLTLQEAADVYRKYMS